MGFEGVEQRHISRSRHKKCDACLVAAGCGESVLLTVPRQGSGGVLIGNITTFIHQAEYMLM